LGRIATGKKIELCKHTAVLAQPAHVTYSVCQNLFLMMKPFQLRYRVYDKHDNCAMEDILYSAEFTERRVWWQNDHER
jgi:hypothetical protein